MSTLEMIIWLVLWIMMGILAAGTGWMLLSGQAAHAESESAIAEFESRGDR